MPGNKEKSPIAIGTGNGAGLTNALQRADGEILRAARDEMTMAGET